MVHDTISQKDYVPKLPEPPFDTVDEDEETIKIVQLVKSNEPLVNFSFHLYSSLISQLHVICYVIYLSYYNASGK